MKITKLIPYIAVGLLLSTSALATAPAALYWNNNSPKDGIWSSSNWSFTDPEGPAISKPTSRDTVNLNKSNSSYIIRGNLFSNVIANLNFSGQASLTLVFPDQSLVVTNTTNISAPSDSTLMLSIGHFDLGSINISGGNLALGSPGVIKFDNSLTFSGPGALKMNGNTQAFASIAITHTDSPGVIDMSGPASKISTLRFGGDFANISTTNYLSIVGYTPGNNQIFFPSSLSGFNSNSIRINGMSTQYNSATGEVTALPEPSTYAAIISGLVLVNTLVIRRRQKHIVPVA